MALRIPALCGVPTLEEAQQVLAITVNQQQALSDGVASLTKQRRQMRAEPHHLEQLGSGREQGNVELIPSKCLFKINFIFVAKISNHAFNILDEMIKAGIRPKFDPFILDEAP
jgi:hypothetical protein